MGLNLPYLHNGQALIQQGKSSLILYLFYQKQEVCNGSSNICFCTIVLNHINLTLVGIGGQALASVLPLLCALRVHQHHPSRCNNFGWRFSLYCCFTARVARTISIKLLVQPSSASKHYRSVTEITETAWNSARLILDFHFCSWRDPVQPILYTV